MRALPRKGYQLGWSRVAVGLACEGKEPTERAIAEWLSKNPGAAELGARQGALAPSALRDPADAARQLGFLDQQLRPTDLGHVLREVEQRSQSQHSPFSHPAAVRWILWLATAQAEPVFWRAALATWRPTASAFEWIHAVAESLVVTIDGENLLPVLRGQPQARPALVERLAKPWFGQLENLGWTEALPRLSAWAQRSPERWSTEDILEGFRMAERLPKKKALPSRLVELLSSLPASLKVTFVNQAAREAVQALGVACGVQRGAVESWYGPGWKSLLRAVHPMGIRETAGAHVASPNLAWSSGASTRSGTEPASAGESVDHMAQPDGVADRESGGGPPSEPPFAPRAAPGGLEESAISVTPSAEDVRARSWLRMLAWWAKGPTAGRLLSGGHDSWQLTQFTLDHWLQEGQHSKWTKRTAELKVLGDLGVDWLYQTISTMGRVNPAHPMSPKAPRDVGREIMSLAARSLPGTIEPPRARLEKWIKSGGDSDWNLLALHTHLWAAGLVERNVWTAESILGVLRTHTRSHSAADAQALLELLSRPVERQVFHVISRMIVQGPDVAKLDGYADESGLELRVLPDLAVPPFHVVEVFSKQTAESQVVAFRQANAAARAAALRADLRFVITLPTDPTQVQDAHFVPLVADSVSSSEAGVGAWQHHRWFELRQNSILSTLGREDSITERFSHSHGGDLASEKLAGLWILLESQSLYGENGRRVCEQLARACYEVAWHAACADAWQAASLLGHVESDAPPVAWGWDQWGQWARELVASDDIKQCHWAFSLVSPVARATQENAAHSEMGKLASQHAMWIFSAVFSVRCRRFHEAYKTHDGAEAMLTRLYEAACELTAELWRHQPTDMGRGARRVLEEEEARVGA